MSKSTPAKKRKKLLAQGNNVNLDSAASYFGVPSGFIRQYWKQGDSCFEDIERWMLSSAGKQLLQSWDSKRRAPQPIDGCDVRYSQMDREAGRPVKTRISDCTVSRHKRHLVVKSGNQELKLPVAMKSLEVRLPYSGEFKSAGESFA